MPATPPHSSIARTVAPRPSRRELLRLLGGGALVTLGAGCVRPLPEDALASATRPRDGNLEVRVFQGGYGVDFYEQAAREYEASHPGVTIDLKGDPRIWEQLRPRFAAGEPPGLAFPGWGMDNYALIYDRQALPLNDVLLTTPYGEEGGTWRDTFLPDVLKLGEYEGQVYLLPYYLTLNGWWFNVGLFRRHGWTPPHTYDELLALCERIKAAGIAPLTYQGKYPYYALQGFVLPWAISIGGMDAFKAAEGLQPGAWKAAPFLEAARKVVELRTRGYFQPGANGMSHTEAQMEFLNERAAMIPCGTWLESEMKKQLPPGFRMRFFLPPTVPGGKGDPTAVQVGVEPWLIPTQGANTALAIDFFKYLTSKKKAREFVLAKGTLTAIRGSAEGDLPETLQGPAEALRNARVTWTTRYAQWYKALEEESRNAMAALLLGEATPEQFVERIEAAAGRVRSDPNIPKHQA
jgi:N-acetylglucosamine transport system substrate-binding protein